MTNRAEKRALIRQLIASLEQVARERGPAVPTDARAQTSVASNIIQFPVQGR